MRACKQNVDGVCQKYRTPKEMMNDFKKGGGCAFTWFFSGKLPQTTKTP